MTFLKKFGLAVLKGLTIVAGFAPLAMPIATTAGASSSVTDHLSQIFKAVTDAEVMGQSLGLAGTDKIRAAAPQVEQVVLDFLALRGIKVSSDQQAKLTAACTALGGNIADILNAAHPDSVVTMSVS